MMKLFQKLFFVFLAIFSFSFSFSSELDCVEVAPNCSILEDNIACFSCVTYDGFGCYRSVDEACSSNGFLVGGTIQGHCFKRIFENGQAVENILGGSIGFANKSFYKSSFPYSCDWANFDTDDPCGNGKDPATCDMDEPNPDPEPPKYDDDYKPEDPPCQIMVNGKCVFEDPNRKDKICSNGKCKCFEKNENGILKEVPCNSYPSYDDDPCGNGKDPATCDDSTANDPPSDDDDTTSNFNPNSQYDDATYNFDGLDTSTNLPDAKDIKDKTQEVDLSSWGVTDYFNSSGQCPAPNTVSLGMFGSFEVSYEYFCSIARILRTVVIAFAWLTGLLIIAKINK